jgi:hypothetical protein
MDCVLDVVDVLRPLQYSYLLIVDSAAYDSVVPECSFNSYKLNDYEKEKEKENKKKND